MVETGLAEELELIDSTGTDRTGELGVFQTATFQISEEHTAERSVDSGGKPVDIREGVSEFPTSLTIKPTSLKSLRIFGEYNEPGDGTYEITFPGDQTLESHNFFRGQIDSSSYFEFTDVKFGQFIMDFGVEDVVTISFDTVLAKDGTIQDGTIDSVDASGSPLRWNDADVLIDDTTVGVVESVNKEVNRNISSEYGITDATGGDARKPVAIIEGNYEFLPSIVVKLTDLTAWENALDDSSKPLEIQASKDGKTISLDFGGTSGKLEFQEAKFAVEEYELNEDKDVKTVELTGNAQDVKVTGDL